MSIRLAESVRVEPLVFGWPAWWCTMAPGAAALHAHRFQLPALRSYLRNPAMHVRAANDPKLAGGAFVGVPEAQREHVEELLGAMEIEYAEDLRFAESWVAFNEELRASAVGQTMEPLYAQVPGPLGGLIELGYDYDNRPSVRFDEGLAYRTPLYRPSRQQVILRSGTRADDARPFYMSTPVFAERVPSATVPFRDAALGALLELDVRPAPSRARARELLDAVVQGSAYDPDVWLTEGPLLASPAFDGEGVRVRHLGHACLLVEHGGRSVLVDPLVAQGTHDRSVFGIESLPERIDVALVTHAHPDHFDLETLVRLRPRIDRVVVPRSRGLLVGDVSLARILRELGYADVIEVDTADRLSVGDGEIVALPFLGEHGDILHGSKATYWIRFGATTLLAAADSACLDPRTYARSRALVGKIDHVFMNTEVDGAPISWPFDALFPKKRDRKLESTRRCRGSNVAEGLQMLETVGATHLYVYAMGLEPWVQRITGPASQAGSPRMVACHELIARASERGVAARRLSGCEELLLGS